MFDKTIGDIECPHCKSCNTAIYSTDEIDFDIDGTGHYFADCSCYDCKKGFRAFFKFKYEITDFYTR